MSVWTSPRPRHQLPEHEADRPIWLELFYDLVFVAVFIQIGNLLADEITWTGVGRVLVLFAPLWWIWSNFVWYQNRFAVDDVVHRVIVVAQIFIVAWLGASVGGAFETHSTQFVLLYVVFRLTMIALYARSLRYVDAPAALLRRYIVELHLVGALAWTGSLLLAPSQRWVVWLATFVYEAVVVGSPRLRAEHRRHPPHLGHLRERYGTLVILVLGETFIKTITGDEPLTLTWPAFAFAAPSVLTLFGMWWLYFADLENGAAGRPRSPVPWLYLHLPLALALIGFGVAKSKLFGSLDGDLSDAYIWLNVGTVAAVCLLLVLLSASRGVATASLRAGAAMVVLGIGAVAVAADLTPVPIAVAVGAVLVALVGIEVAGKREPSPETVPAGAEESAPESRERQ